MKKKRKKASSTGLKAKETRIFSISDENNELHPLLDELFRKIPGIVDVEYRQGTNEKGADFVLQKRDETFGTTEYIGVVAKIGTIHQSLIKVEEQIEECVTLERFVENGKKRIFLHEVWVVFTGNTTPNAEEKIFTKFHSHKIRFIDGRRLQTFLDQYLPYFWDDVPLETGRYLRETAEQLSRVERHVSLFPDGSTDDVYVEPDLYTFPENKYKRKVQRLQRSGGKVDLYREISSHKLLLIEGDMGVGKSKLIRRLGEHYSTPAVFNETRILPIPASFREFFDDFEGNVEKLLEAKVTPELGAELPKDVTYLLLIDGMDEKRLGVNEQLDYLEMLIASVGAASNFKMVLTTRPLKGFDDTVQLNAGIETYLLQPLSFSKSLQLIQKICDKLNMADRIVEDLKKSSLFKELPKNPIAIILLANLLNDNSQEIPSNLTELYSKYVELALGRWDVSKGFQNQKEYEVLQNVMMRLSAFIMDNDLKYVGVTEAKGFFESYLKERNVDLNPDELFGLMMDRTELMIYSSDSKAITFKHKTFAEFLYAKYSREQKGLTIDNRAFQNYWMNTFFFYTGLAKDAEPIIEDLLRVVPNDNLESFLRVANMGNLMLAGYLTPSKTIENGVTQIAIEASRLYQAIVERETDLALNRLPRMHILWLFQMLMRNGYAFEFFKGSVESAALDIVTSDLKDADKAYALFFLSVIYIDITKNRTFGYLLENVQTLPLDISLAYLVETKDVTKRTDLMKKTDKKIRKSLGGSRKEIDAVQALFSDPLKSFKQVDKKVGGREQ